MSLIIKVEDWLAHYGTPRKSGRYPFGSGKDETVYEGSFLDITTKLLKTMPQKKVAEGFGLTTSELRARRSIESNERRLEKEDAVKKLADKGMSPSAIAKQLNKNESSIRSTLASMQKDKARSIHTIADMLKDEVDQKTYVQIGVGVEHLPHLGISANRLHNAVAVLKEHGYKVWSVQEDQLGSPGNKTTVKVLAPPGTTYRDVVANKHLIRLPGKYSDDGGDSFSSIKPPLNIDPKRIKIVYKEDGGDLADGLIHVRPGVEDVSLGGKNYAQVRIAVGGTHYIKGMAVYKDDLPKGTDLAFHTNKSSTGNKLDALKPQEIDKTTGKINLTNPFGASIRRQILDEKGEKPKSAMNILDEEGTWSDWSKTLSSQVLSKQTPQLAKQQLDARREGYKQEFDQLKSLTNPTVRRHLLEAFSESVDSSAVHLEAAHLPRQAYHVLLPVKSLKTSEVYAPNHNDGDTVVLIRFPHGGKFEIPELVVNNKNREAIKMMGKNARDAVGIHPKVAEKLSGADFDGDTVLVIPNHPNSPRRIQSEPALRSLKGFDPKALYKLPDDAPHMKPKTKGLQMGMVSNLITDMTIKGASNEELARAVKHSMVVIDAEKHHLDYKRSYKDHSIRALYTKYAQSPNGGAATLISRAGSPVDAPVTSPRRVSEGGPIDRRTGRKMETPKTFITRDGTTVTRMKKVKRLSVTDDAFDLVSDKKTKVEVVYAEHSNALKSMANDARKEVADFKPPRVDLNAKKVYKSEVDSIVAKLVLARSNAPLERQAQIFANAVVAKQLEADPTMDRDVLKKIKGQALATARVRMDAKKTKIVPTPEEWAAIQAGAVSQNQLNQILDHADIDAIRQLATPRLSTKMTPTKEARAKAMVAQGYNQAEIASALGVSTSTISEIIN